MSSLKITIDPKHQLSDENVIKFIQLLHYPYLNFSKQILNKLTGRTTIITGYDDPTLPNELIQNIQRSILSQDNSPITANKLSAFWKLVLASRSIGKMMKFLPIEKQRQLVKTYELTDEELLTKHDRDVTFQIIHKAMLDFRDEILADTNVDEIIEIVMID